MILLILSIIWNLIFYGFFLALIGFMVIAAFTLRTNDFPNRRKYADPNISLQGKTAIVTGNGCALHGQRHGTNLVFF